MSSYPLIRTWFSNERLMSALAAVLVLYNLPRFIEYPNDILSALLLLVFGLILDSIIGFVRYKKPVCAVSAAVTALILFSLSPGAPLWAELAALAAALIVGKHIWGGTGKNPINPAMIGLLFVGHIDSIFVPSLLLLPAVLLSLPFLLFRPYAGLGLIIGMSAAILIKSELSPQIIIGSGVFFWGCLVITDPATTTPKPLPGGIIGLLAGFIPVILGGNVSDMALSILISNALSYICDRFDIGKAEHITLSLKNRRIPFSREMTELFDLTDNAAEAASEGDFGPDEILSRIEQNNVFGFGGAGFPTGKKIKAFLNSNSEDRHLIINAAECDPGLIHDKWLLAHRADDIAGGIELMCKCTSFTSVNLAAKDIDGLGFGFAVNLKRVPDYYPAGAERFLIKEVLGKDISSDELPADRGILVLNVQTLISIYEAVCSNKNADARYLTVADLDTKKGAVVYTGLGHDVREIAEKVYPGHISVYTGGGIMNSKLSPDGAEISETVNFIAVGKFKGYREALCSRCGFCDSVCPMHLNVRETARLVDDGKVNDTGRFHPEKCLNCGSCSYICFAGRNLGARMAEAKTHCKSA